MFRSILGTGLVVGLVAATGPIHAQAPVLPPVQAPLQAPAQSPPQSLSSNTVAAACPRGPVSIYFASGDATASPQTRALLGKVGETVGSCQPDRIDIIARVQVDADGLGAEGEQSLSIAMARLSLVAADLVERGLPADRIRVSALATLSGMPGSALQHIEIRFRKDSDAPLIEEPRRTDKDVVYRQLSII